MKPSRNIRDGVIVTCLFVGCLAIIVVTQPKSQAVPIFGALPTEPAAESPLKNLGTVLLQSRPRDSARAMANVSTQQPPPLALCFPCKVTSVHDGDTCKVSVSFELTVRYDNCWAPELKDKGGKESAERAKEATGKDGRLYIDMAGVHNIGNMLTFGRVVGELWLDSETESESMKQVRLKLASTKKGGELGK